MERDTQWNGIKEFRVIGDTGAKPPVEGTITSLDSVSVDTVVGKIPELPGKVLATYDNGDKALVPVTWDEIKASDVAQATDFEVKGTVEGTPLSASCRVYVNMDKPAWAASMGEAREMQQEKDHKRVEGKGRGPVWDTALKMAKAG